MEKNANLVLRIWSQSQGWLFESIFYGILLLNKVVPIVVGPKLFAWKDAATSFLSAEKIVEHQPVTC